MSFSSDIKHSLIDEIPSAMHCRIAELLALLSLNSECVKASTDTKKIYIKTEGLTVASKSYILLKKLFKVSPQVCVRRYKNGNESKSYRLLISKADTDSILKMYTYTDSGRLHMQGMMKLIESTCCKKAFLRGVFLSSGSVTDPSKSYHLEMVLPDEAMLHAVLHAMNAYGFEPGTVLREKRLVVYLKDSSKISDFLSLIGAGKAMMELENIKILKEVRNNVNRQVNCETANITKTVSAAHKQIEDIKQLKMSGNFDKLTPALREIAELRLAHPEASLSELASMVGDGISRSGINHRLKKIATIADTYH